MPHLKENKMNIIVSDELRQACPDFRGAAILADVHNSEYSEALSKQINEFLADYRRRYTIDSLKLMPAIQATRAAYKACGKDPSRYRPSSEALIRRTLRGMELYKVDTLVDAVNLASIAYGYSIGGFDADKIQGDTLTLGIGRAGEPYEGIGRGPLNIEGLPVYRDQIGGIGTPTSDHERTKLSLSTTRLLAVVNGYGGGEFLDDTVTLLQSLLHEYAASDGGTVLHF
jgi:DNA/RNA-binding domain of Phe-tRNA-synthetase-like protein